MYPSLSTHTNSSPFTMSNNMFEVNTVDHEVHHHKRVCILSTIIS